MSVKRLVPLHAVALPAHPSEARMGDLYYNTQDQELKFHDGTEWHAVGAGAITGLLDHIHTYDGQIFSVSANTVGSTGTLDGGTPFSEYGNLPANLDAGEA
jgi:hypothetical protein